jgi:hypothetical protein
MKENVLTLDGGEIVARKIKITELANTPEALQADMVLLTDATGQYVIMQHKDTFGGAMAMVNLDGGTASSPEEHYNGIENIDAGGI